MDSDSVIHLDFSPELQRRANICWWRSPIWMLHKCLKLNLPCFPPDLYQQYMEPSSELLLILKFSLLTTFNWFLEFSQFCPLNISAISLIFTFFYPHCSCYLSIRVLFFSLGSLSQLPNESASPPSVSSPSDIFSTCCQNDLSTKQIWLYHSLNKSFECPPIAFRKKIKFLGIVCHVVQNLTSTSKPQHLLLSLMCYLFPRAW